MTGQHVWKSKDLIILWQCPILTGHCPSTGRYLTPWVSFGSIFLWNWASDISQKKKQNFAGFSGANSRKNRPTSREISDWNFANKQSVKNSRFRWIFFGRFRYYRSILRRYDQRCLTFFLTMIIICSFNNSSLEKWVNAKAINIMVSAQFFATFI